MTIKTKISIYISVGFTLFFGIVSFFVIYTFSIFRQEEFKERLNEKALTSIKLLLDVKEVDKYLLKKIDQNNINKLFTEKTLIFDANYNLIYSSLDDTRINWTPADLQFLKKNNSFFRKDGDNELYGLFYDSNNEDYYVLISARDNYGKRTLDFLIYLSVVAYLIFILITWLFSFYFIKRQLAPLNNFHRQIKEINEYNISGKLNVKENSKNEIDLLSNEFSLMMDRISDAYQKQKEFTAQASHELRTPLARMSAQIENHITGATEKEQLFLRSLLTDINQLNELVKSLLLLSRADVTEGNKTETARIDEVIYNSIEKLHSQFPNLKINFNINPPAGGEMQLEVKSNPALLEIAFYNLIKNAYLYSDNQVVEINISNEKQLTLIVISNTGTTLSEEEQKRLFQPFMRGNNAAGHTGLGLGLRIIHRILSVYGFTIKYEAQPFKNNFTVSCRALSTF
jgi:two-component system sensor histidine kinase ArlS